MSTFAIANLIVWPPLAVAAFCALALGGLLAGEDEPVFTRAAFALLARSVHRAPRTPLRHRLRGRRSEPEQSAEAPAGPGYARDGEPCRTCRDETGAPCRCFKDCGHIRCTGVRQP